MSYGLTNNKINYIKNYKLKQKFKIKSLNLNIKNCSFSQKLIIYFYLPFNWKFLLINFKKIKTFLWFYLYSNFYFINFFLKNNFNNFFFDNQLKLFKFFYLYDNFFFKFYWNFFNFYFNSFNFFFFKKIKFKGKGYYIFKNFRNSFIFHFGYSHKINIFFFFFYIKFLSKNSILIFGLNKNELNFNSFLFKKIKFLNIFTLKGIRFSKQIIYKKTGKISSYK